MLPRASNLLVDLDQERLAAQDVHNELEALDLGGIYIGREHRTPENVLGWIDGHFGGTWSTEAARGGIWTATATTTGERVGFCAYDVRGLRYRWLKAWVGRASVGLVGPLGVLPEYRNQRIGAGMLRAALFSLRERGYRQALIPAVAPETIPFYEKAAGAWFVERADLGDSLPPARTTILASGNGGNFAAVAAAASAGDLPLEITALVSNKPGPRVLERAAAADVPATLVAWDREVESRDAYDERVVEAVAATEPELVLLLGWMHVLPATFVARFPQTLNLHPAFLPLDPSANDVTMPDGTVLPAYRGPHAFRDAVDAGSAWSGATVHRLGVAIDRGEVMARAPFRLDGDAADFGRLREVEARVIGTALRRWHLERADSSG